MKTSPELEYTPFAEIDKCYQFASSIIMFGGLLRNSKFIKEASWNDVLLLASQSADQSNYSQKEFLTLLTKAKNLYGKKKKKKAERNEK
jgi:Ca-activated chloride channel family protein